LTCISMPPTDPDFGDDTGQFAREPLAPMVERAS
jgi:hypothetical protein